MVDDNLPRGTASRLIPPSTPNSVPDLPTLHKSEEHFLQNRTSQTTKITDPFSLCQVSNSSPTFRRLTPPSTELLSFTLRYIATALIILKGVHSSAEWYPDFGGRRYRGKRVFAWRASSTEGRSRVSTSRGHRRQVLLVAGGCEWEAVLYGR